MTHISERLSICCTANHDDRFNYDDKINEGICVHCQEHSTFVTEEEYEHTNQNNQEPFRNAWYAIQSYKITRLAAVIHLLRESGMHIESVKKKNVGGKNWVEYRYHHEDTNGQFNLI